MRPFFDTFLRLLQHRRCGFFFDEARRASLPTKRGCIAWGVKPPCSSTEVNWPPSLHPLLAKGHCVLSLSLHSTCRRLDDGSKGESNRVVADGPCALAKGDRDIYLDPTKAGTS